VWPKTASGAASGEEALPLVAQLGSEEPAATDDRGGADAPAAVREHHHVPAAPITNAESESINAKIQWVKYTARGFRNKRNFVHAICFHCGGLHMAPEATKYPEAPNASSAPW
jgi:hypothetical protein